MSVVVKLPAGTEHGRRKRRRLRSLEFLPTLFTIGNLLCGFAAIHFGLRAMYDLGAGLSTLPTAGLDSQLLERMLPSFLSVGAGLVILGMVFDCFDGLIARVTRSTTNFGGQLDSLADVVTFGVAPATLMVALMTKELARDSIMPSPISDHLVGRMAWVSAAVYVAMAAIRLARFNVEHAKVGADYKTFRGLPSPGAAAIIISLILLHDQPHGEHVKGAIVYSLPGIALGIGFLMVSRVSYKRFQAYLVGRQPFGRFFLLMLLLAVFWSFKAWTFVVVVLWYGLSGPVSWTLRWLRRKHFPLAPAETPPHEATRKHA